MLISINYKRDNVNPPNIDDVYKNIEGLKTTDCHILYERQQACCTRLVRVITGPQREKKPMTKQS